MTDATAAPFYAFRVPPQREAAADEILRKRGFASFYPFEVITRRVNRHARHQIVERKCPIVHGMIWAEHDGSPDWWTRIHRIAIIGRPFGIGGRARPFTPAEMDRMAQLSGRKIELERAKRLTAGATVRVTSGIYAGRECLVTEFSEADRRGLAKLGITMMGQEIKLPAAQLEVIREAA